MEELPIKYFDLKDKTKGVFAMGLVGEPAIQEDWVKLGKKNPSSVFKLKTANKEKRIITGLALVPEIDIYREDKNGQGYNLRFDAETIEELSQGLIRNKNQSETTIDHDFKVDGVHLCESWIVVDEVHDKTVKLGLNPVVGAWALSYKVDNEEVWNDYIKTGVIKGFSIEAMEGKLSKQLNNNKMSKPSLKDSMISFLTDWGNDEVTLAEFVTEDGAVTLIADALEQGKPVFVKSEGEDDVPAPDGSYLMPEGVSVSVSDGVIESVETAEAPTEEEMKAKEAQELEAEKQKATELAAIKEGDEKLNSILELMKEQKDRVYLTKEDVQAIVKAELEAQPTKLKNMGAPKEEEVVKPTRQELAAMSIEKRAAYLVSQVKK